MKKVVFSLSLVVVVYNVSGVNQYGGDGFGNNKRFLEENAEIGHPTKKFKISSWNEALSCRDSIEILNSDNLEILALGGEFPALKELTVKESDLLSIPLDTLYFPQLIKLKICNVTGKSTDRVCELIAKNSSTLLDLEVQLLESEASNKSMFEIPASVWDCKKLTSLNLNGCGVKVIPPEIENLTELEYLNLESNDIDNLPQQVWNLRNLEYVMLDDRISIRRFITLDSEFFDLEYMFGPDYEQVVSESQSSGEECEIGLDDEQVMATVKKIDLSNQSLTELPLDIIMCEGLEELNISNNKLTEIPSLFTKLERLKKIDVRGNEKINSIKKIPDDILFLSELESIILTEEGKDKEYNRDEISRITARIFEEEVDEETRGKLNTVRSSMMSEIRARSRFFKDMLSKDKPV